MALPLPYLFDGDQIHAHLDMAEISIIAAKTGITTLSNFRLSDMARGLGWTLRDAPGEERCCSKH